MILGISNISIVSQDVSKCEIELFNMHRLEGSAHVTSNLCFPTHDLMTVWISKGHETNYKRKEGRSPSGQDFHNFGEIHSCGRPYSNKCETFGINFSFYPPLLFQEPIHLNT